MAEQQTLIAQALAIVEEHKPASLADSIPLDPQQALVYALYVTTRERDAGRATEDEVRKLVATARSAGIAEHEIGATFAAASDQSA